MRRALLLASLSLLGTLPIAPAATCTQPPEGLVSWWSGNGSATDTVGTNNGVLMGGAAFARGEVGEAFSFDGVSGWVDIPNSASLNPTGPFSVEAWIKANPQQLTAGGIFLIVDKSHGWSDGTGWVLQGNANGTVGFAYGIGGSSSPASFPEVNTLASVLDNQWHHLAGVFTGTQLQIYLDGGLQSTLNQTSLPVNNQRDAEIGRSWGGGTPTRYFHGLIDEVSYYNRGLSSNEVAAIYAAGSAGKCAGTTSPSNCVPAAAGMVAWWTGNSDANDVFGSSNGSLQAGAAIAAGLVGGAFDLPPGGYVLVPDNPALTPTNTITVEAWIYPRSQLGAADPIVKKAGDAGTTSDGYSLEFAGTGLVAFWVYLGSGGWQSTGSGPVAANRWTHLAGSYDGATLRLYVNGVLANSRAVTGTMKPSHNPLNLGADPSSPDRHFDGLIDEVSIYSRALSGGEIESIYAAGAAGKCSAAPVTQPGLRADYRFQNNLLSSVGNPPALSNQGSNTFVTATVDGMPRTFLTFGFNDGLLLQPGTSVIPSNVYSVVILVALEDVSYYRRLLGFPAIATDEGWYVHNGRLCYWPVVDGSSEAVAAGQFVQFVLTRAPDGTVRGYVDGVLQTEFPDADGSAGPGTNGLLRFFQDNATDASAGLVARIRIYDIALAEAQVAALDRLPPAGPILVLSRAGDMMTVSWPTNYTGYRLRSAPSLTPPMSWNIVNNVSVSGPVLQATVSATNNSGFFQLVKP